MPDVPRSSQFDDVYFSKEDGLAETRHVFIDGNNLPDAWQGRDQFTIFETGFGTGLNFLETWRLFEETKQAGQTLDFISVEKYPLKPEDIKKYLSHWDAEFGAQLEQLLSHYPAPIQGYHRLKLSQDVTLTLIFDDINVVMPEITARIDAWFLDGFTPAKNPDMWRDVLFKNMKRLSNTNANVATFTSAGDVRRGLENAGFEITKTKGFGHKREMMRGVFKVERATPAIHKPPKSIAIIGAGLAGTAMGYWLQQYGFNVTLYEQSDKVASGASGNSRGFYSPRFTAQRDEAPNFFAPAYAHVLKLGAQHGVDFDFNPCGSLYIINTPEKEKRFSKLLQTWGWNEDYIKTVTQSEASEIAGIQLEHPCLYLPQAGSLSPKKLCEFYARNLDIRFNHKIDDISEIDADITILCNAYAVRELTGLNWLPAKIVRGQITSLQSNETSQHINCNIHYNGSISPAYNGIHSCGASFQKWEDTRDTLPEDDDANIERLKQNLPIFDNSDFDITSSWAGLRTASTDHFPIVGTVPDMENTYISTAFSSHGILGTISAAHYMADILRGGHAMCLPAPTQYALSAQRFIDRANKRSGLRA